MSTHSAALTDFLTRYADTLSRFDAHGAADLWAVPGMIVDDRFSGVTDTREAMIEGLTQSYPLYQQLGLATVDHELLDTIDLTASLVLVHVRWIFRDEAGDQLTDSNPYYLLRRDDSGELRACVCVQADDREKLQALAADHGIQLPTPE